MYKYLLIVIAIVIVIVCCSYNYGIGAVSKNTDSVIVKIEDNSTYSSIAPLLKEKNLIRSVNFYKLYLKIFMNGLGFLEKQISQKLICFVM